MICIKDMKIPQSCDACRFYSYSDNGDYCSASEHCLDITNLVDTRHGDCPLAEIDVANGTVLPKGHGDLIDRKEAMEIIAKGKRGKAYFGILGTDWEVIDFLKTVPTIIEADKGE